MSKFRGYCFTLNNWTQPEYDALWGCSSTYIIIGKEVGESGTPHLQGYIEFENPRSFKSVKKICERAHWEARRGTPKEASDYCKKDANFLEKGMIGKGQGYRSDLAGVVAAISSKKFDAMDFPDMYIKFHGGIDKLICKQMLPRSIDTPPEVIWLWGEAGVGKTKYAFDRWPAADIYIKDGTMWWNGYTQQTAIVIDDFDGKWPYRDFLRLLDRYPYQGQTKGGYVHINSPHIVITCEFPPYRFWQNSNELLQITRRISKLLQVERKFTGTEVASNTMLPPPPLYEEIDDINPTYL